MTNDNPKLEELRDQVKKLSKRLDAVLEHSGADISNNGGEIMDKLKRELSSKLGNVKLLKMAAVAAVNSLFDEIQPAVQGSWKSLSGKAEDWMEKAQGGMEDLKENIDSQIEMTKKAEKRARHYIGRNPWSMVGLAAAVGFLAGWLVSREGEE